MKKLQERFRKEASQPHKGNTESETPQPWLRRYFLRPISRTKWVLNLILAVLAFAGGYALLHPHVSVEPELQLNPVDPTSTQFTVTNDNSVFSITDVRPACSTVLIETSNHVRLEGLPPLPSPPIPLIPPRDKSTFNCVRWIGGLGSGAGDVLKAYTLIELLYKQKGWPFATTQRFPFKGLVDSQKAVHWTHRTLFDFQ